MSTPDDVFGEDYWRWVDQRGRTCRNCGHVIRPELSSPTGWTHDGLWQGVRCPQMICGADPDGD